MLDVAAAIAAGRSALGHPAQPPVRVLYVDLENSRDDLAERLRDMGYGPGDLAALRYLSFPTLPPLDGAAGGRDIVDVAEHHDAALIVIDTVARVVAGEENWQTPTATSTNNTLAPLKAKRRAVVRLDHRGKALTPAPVARRRKTTTSMWFGSSVNRPARTVKRTCRCGLNVSAEVPTRSESTCCATLRRGSDTSRRMLRWPPVNSNESASASRQ